jgi:pyruvate formate lyase activating enzyme
MDAERHKLFTGVDNSLILENIRRLSRFGKEIWVRVPVIPGFNNTQIEMESIADFVQTLNSVSNVTLIPYHNLGAGKYTTLGLNYPYDTQLKVSEAEMEAYRNIFFDRHISLN